MITDLIPYAAIVLGVLLIVWEFLDESAKDRRERESHLTRYLDAQNERREPWDPE